MLGRVQFRLTLSPCSDIELPPRCQILKQTGRSESDFLQILDPNDVFKPKSRVLNWCYTIIPPKPHFISTVFAIFSKPGTK